MLRYKTVNIIFVGSILMLCGLIYLGYSIHWSIFIGLFLVHSLLVFYGSYFVHSNFFTPVLCKGELSNNQIALSFDDGPNAEFTLKVLDVLKEYQATATFFCIGKHVKDHPEILVNIYEQGHLIGNHTYHHANLFDLYPTSRVKKELQETEQIIYHTIHKKTKLFRPPYGVTNPPIAKAVKQLDYLSIGWSVRSLDTVVKEKDKIVERVTKDLKGGDIILFHDISQRTVEALKETLQYCQDHGIKIVGIDELLTIKAYEED